MPKKRSASKSVCRSTSKCRRSNSSLGFSHEVEHPIVCRPSVIKEEEDNKVCRKELEAAEQTTTQPEKKKRGRPKRTSARFKSKVEKQKKEVKCKSVKPKGKPEEDKPEEDKPEEEKPDEDKPDENKPDVDKPDEDKPDEDKPDENKPKDRRGRPNRNSGRGVPKNKQRLDEVISRTKNFRDSSLDEEDTVFRPKPHELGPNSTYERKTLRSHTVTPIYTEGQIKMAAKEWYESKEFQDKQNEKETNYPVNTSVEQPSSTCLQFQQNKQFQPNGESDFPMDNDKFNNIDELLENMGKPVRLISLKPQNNLQLYFSNTFLANIFVETDILNGLFYNTWTTVKEDQLFFNFLNLAVPENDEVIMTINETVNHISQLET